MGYKHIVWVNEDGMRQKTAGLEQAFGQALLKVCLNPDYAHAPEGPERVWWADVGNHGGCINWVDEVHQSDSRLYLWDGNCLRPLRKLDDEALQQAAALLQEEIKRRAKNNQSQL